jgi:hypothetical protein
VNDRPLRVVQCGRGIGLRALREVIRHPHLELVGVRGYDPAEDGVDGGDRRGERPVGVTATTGLRSFVRSPPTVRCMAAIRTTPGEAALT